MYPNKTYVVKVGCRRQPIRKYSVSRLLYTHSGFQTVFVCSLECSDLGIAKNVSLTKMQNPRSDIIVIVDFYGVSHYYHPKYRKWYKGLTKEQLGKYFYWLLPEKVSK